MHIKMILLFVTGFIIIFYVLFNNNCVEGLALSSDDKNMLGIYQADLDKINNYKLSDKQQQFYFLTSANDFNNNFKTITDPLNNSVNTLVSDEKKIGDSLDACNKKLASKVNDFNRCEGELQTLQNSNAEGHQIVAAQKKSFGII